MKKIVLLAVFAFAGLSVNAQTTKKAPKKAETKTITVSKPEKTEGPVMVFESETIDYGKVEHNADGNRQFVFTNKGNKPLIITETKGSCGCTVPTKPEKPIMPGEKGVIGVKYATDRIGAFTKTVTVTSNASDAPKTLTIKGEVLPDPAPAAEPKKS